MAEPDIPLVFVVGTGRCGTHTLWKVFESVPNTLSTHEGNGVVRNGPAPLVGKRVALGCMPELNAYLYHFASDEVFARTFAPDAAMLALMDACFAGRARAITWCAAKGIAYCDANAFGFNFINYLHLRFPRARFIHLVRDGYACVRSWSRRDESTYPDEVPQMPWAISWLLAKPMPLRADPARASWDRYDRLQKISWFWSTVNANIAARLERIPLENRRLVRIEEVTQATLPGILDFCGLSRQYAPDSLLPDDVSDGPSVEWTSANERKFNEIAAPMMVQLGYPLR